MLAPIALFVYNRPWHTQQTVESLQKNILSLNSDLFIYSDGPKSDAQADLVSQVRQYINHIQGFKSVTIVERAENFGLARSIIDGVTSIIAKHERVIVLEDDMVTSPYFLDFMNAGLNTYAGNSDVASIHGYVYPIEGLPETFFMRGADCWGWATWRDRWVMFEPDGAELLKRLNERSLTKRFDFNGAYPFIKMLRDQISGANNSWAIRWHASAFLNSKYTLYPGKSLVLNIGNDGSGTHCDITDSLSSDVVMMPVHVTTIPVKENESIFNKFQVYFQDQQIESSTRLRRITEAIVRKLKWFL